MTDATNPLPLEGEVLGRLKPFRAALGILEPLKLPDERSLQSCLPGAWPDLGELRRLVATAEALLADHARLVEAVKGVEELRALREAGWSVAVHNDYSLRDERFTFWLFAHPCGRWVKGEGHTDAEAIAAAALSTATQGE